MDGASRFRLSIVIPTAHPWPMVERALAAALDQDCDQPYEILVLDGHGEALPAAPKPPVQWLRAPGADVFALRAMAVAAARGDIVAISEDHCLSSLSDCHAPS